MDHKPVVNSYWSWAMAHSSGIRASHYAMLKMIPYSFLFRSKENDVLFLANAGETSLFSMSTRAENLGECAGLVNPQPQTQSLSQAAILLRERMRKSGSGISGYDHLEETGEVLVHLGMSSLLCGSKGEVIKELEHDGAVDIKPCPWAYHIMACVLDKDLWMLDARSGTKTRLTYTHTPQTELLSAGQPSFITQEEFDRYTGYWWQPKGEQNDGVYRILYEEVDESGVEELYTLNPSSNQLEKYRYPLVGTKNATSALKILEFTLENSSESDKDIKVNTVVKVLPQSFADLWSDYEYLVRCGWTPDGQNVWVQLLNRSHQNLKLVFVPLECFTASVVQEATDVPMLASQCCVVLEESSPHWINVADILHFLPAGDSLDTYQFLWSSEQSGYRHLELVTTTPSSPVVDDQAADVGGSLRACATQRKPLTAGEWVVSGDQIWVDNSRHLVYFMANAKTCLENHLHVASWDADSPNTNPTQLTASEFCHEVEMNKECDQFISTYSSLQSFPRSVLFKIKHNDDGTVSTEIRCSLTQQMSMPANYSAPSVFTFQAASGEVLYGTISKPLNCPPGKRFPVVLYVYGGPHIQNVRNTFSHQQIKTRTWTTAGYVVITIDNRGSFNRGIKFEAYLQNKMGWVEIEDQVTGLQHIAQQEQCIDLSRVAIHGWSYGGYLALMGLAQRPDVFKVAIAGGPVSAWEDYDTGYTERYLSVPSKNRAGYEESSVLNCAHKFPSEPNRLLLVHGMNDENVFFRHTSKLIDCLVRAGKPYQLLAYCGERHGLRSYHSVRHSEAAMLTFLKQYL